MEEKVLQLGERRAITLKIWLKDNAAFTPQDGAYWNLRCEIQPKRRTVYNLTFTFQVGSEIVKKAIRIRVI